MRSPAPLAFLIIPLPDQDPLNAENGPGSLRAPPEPTLKSSNPATAAALTEHNAWNCNAITSAPSPADATTTRLHPVCYIPSCHRQSLGLSISARQTGPHLT